MKIHSGEQPTMSREEMADDYLRLKLEYTRLHEDYRRLQSKNNKQLLLHNVSQQRELLFDLVDKMTEDSSLNCGDVGRWYVEKYLSNNCG